MRVGCGAMLEARSEGSRMRGIRGGGRTLALFTVVMYPAGATVETAPNTASSLEKATRHHLMRPDWAVNLEICDIINADVW
jgi:hypothetical protein